jgi:uncharacterized protein YebE (UPF0316 family)
LVSLIITILLKALDSFISTTKSIFVYKNEQLIACGMIGLSQYLFLTVISAVVLQQSLVMNLLVSFAATLGAFIAFKTTSKFSKDKTFTNIITSKHKEDMLELWYFLKKHNIDHILGDCYNLEGEKANKTLRIDIFTRTRHENKLIDDFIEENNKKYFREITKR